MQTFTGQQTLSFYGATSEGIGSFHLEIVGVVVCPRQQHRSKQISSSHEDGIHFRNFYSDSLCCPAAVGTGWSCDSSDSGAGRVVVKLSQRQKTNSRRHKGNDAAGLPWRWLPSDTRKRSPSLEGRSEEVMTTVSGPIAWSRSITWGQPVAKQAVSVSKGGTLLDRWRSRCSYLYSVFFCADVLACQQPEKQGQWQSEEVTHITFQAH